jgi:SOS-response transcriptional repressor LexA
LFDYLQGFVHKALAMRLSVKEKSSDEVFKAFAAKLRERIGFFHVQNVAEAMGYPRNTLDLWGKYREPTSFPVPDIWDALAFSKAANCSPAWFAFDIGPRDPRMAAIAFALGEQLEKTPGAKEMLATFMGASDSNRAMLSQVAANIPHDRKPVVTPARPRNLHIEVNHDAHITALSVRKPQAPYGDRIPGFVPIEKKPMYRNTRTDFPIFHRAANAKTRSRAVPMFLKLAAGPGRELERCDDIHSFREFVPHGVHAAKVQGHSMLDTIRHGETILLQAFDAGQGTKLSALLDNESKTPYAHFQQHVRNDEIWIREEHPVPALRLPF